MTQVATAPTRSRDRSPQGPRAVVAGVLAALLVAVGSWVPSLWTDEAATISAATRSVPDLWRMVHTIDAVHGTYYLFMHGWISVFGQSGLALRAPSAIAVGVATAGVYLLAVRLGWASSAPVAAVAFVLLPRVAWMGIEARPFAFATAAGVWATLVLLVAVDRRRARWWVLYGALVAVAILLNLYLVLLLGAHLVSLLLTRRADRGSLVPWFVSAGLGAVATVPMIGAALGQSGQIGEVPRSLPELARNVAVNQWFLGETPTVYSRSGNAGIAETGIQMWQVGSVLLATVFFVLVLFALGSAWLRRPLDGPTTALLTWALPWLVVPTGVLLVYAVVSDSYSPRYLSFTAPAIALLAVFGLASLRRYPLQVVVATVLVSLAIPVLVSQRTVNAKSGSDWRQVAERVSTQVGPGDGVYFSPRYAATGPEVRLTTRGVAVAYPQAFERLVDLTSTTTPTEAGDLLGTSLRIDDAADRLEGVNALVVIRRHDYPATAADADDAMLEGVGFVRGETWNGALDQVVTFQR